MKTEIKSPAFSERAIISCTIAVLFVALSGCASHREVSRNLSPDGRVEAIIDEVDGGATTSLAYVLYLVPEGTQKLPSQKYAVFVADHIAGLSVNWVEPKLLDLTFRDARIFQFSNFWESADVDSFNYVVKLRLHEQPAVRDTMTEPEIQWATVRKLRQIPESVLNLLLSHSDDNRRLVDQSEPYNATDIGSSLPSRRLVLAGNRGTEWFVAYEHGGRGHHLDLVVLDVRGTDVKSMFSKSLLNVGTYDETTGWRLELADILPTLRNETAEIKGGDRLHY
jgi:hypothetical protein